MLEMKVQSIVSLPEGNGNPLQSFADNAHGQKCLVGYSPGSWKSWTRQLNNKLNTVKIIHDKPTDNIILCGEKLKALPLRSGKVKDAHLKNIYWTDWCGCFRSSRQHAGSFVVAHRLFICGAQASLLCGMWGLSSLTSDQTHTALQADSQPLGSPRMPVFETSNQTVLEVLARAIT